MPNRPNYGRWGNETDDYFQRYKGALDQFSQAQMEGALGANQSAENDLYRYIGLQQQQMERDIKQRRMQALKSGATSAQLASQELQSMLASQQGAQQVARDYMNQRQAIQAQYAGYEQGNQVRALEDYAQRMMQADNIQAQYDVARIQTDPTVAAAYIAEQLGYDWETATESERLQFLDIATGVMEASDFRPSGTVGSNEVVNPFKGGMASYNNHGILGFADTTAGVARYLVGKESSLGRSLGASQAMHRGDWAGAAAYNPKATKKALEKNQTQGGRSTGLTREEADQLIKEYYGG